MFIRELKLTNIRSYREQTITFQKGVTLLAGDIGSGKTTILLALEFALFGILRGKVAPAELLRHGETTGSVTLSCVLQDKEVLITRALRRRSNAIQQLPGEIVIDGQREELVPTELKARVLTLMGYPESLLSKSTNLFRYTVYTPQEEVKQILHESIDERKDVIRKIFQIDKYQTVGRNISIYAGDVRERAAHLRGQLEDLPKLEEQLQSLTQEAEKVRKELPDLKAKLEVHNAKVEAIEVDYRKLQKELRDQQELRTKYEYAQKEARRLEETLESLRVRLGRIKEEFAQMKQEKAIEFDSEQLQKLKDLIAKCREKQQRITTRLGELSGRKQSVSETTIQDMDICPTCRQPVTDEHKDHVRADQEKKLNAIDEQIVKLKDTVAMIEEKEEGFDRKLEELRKRQQQHAVQLSQHKHRERLRKEIDELDKEIAKTQDEHKNKLEERRDLEKRVAALPKIDTEAVEGRLREQRREQQLVQQHFTTTKTRAEMAEKSSKQVERTIAQKRKVKKMVDRLTGIRTWAVELLTPLVGVMEKRVLLRVYREFQTYFTQWFSMLVNDQELSVRLDEEFTPLVEQHGFDTTLANLSGGEKTGVALAYRLALNKVLNDYFSSLHTKGLLILDEPTDGFSSEQIDRLREVFEEVGVEQLILVSHEVRLESVADHVVHLHKQHHQSLIEG